MINTVKSVVEDPDASTELKRALADLLAAALVADYRQYPKLPESFKQTHSTVVSPRGFDRKAREPAARDAAPAGHRKRAPRGQGRPCSREAVRTPWGEQPKASAEGVGHA